MRWLFIDMRALQQPPHVPPDYKIKFWYVSLVWFGLLLYVPGNSSGHVGTVISPNNTFYLGKLEQAVNLYFVYLFSLVTDNNPSWMQQRKEGEWP